MRITVDDAIAHQVTVVCRKTHLSCKYVWQSIYLSILWNVWWCLLWISFSWIEEMWIQIATFLVREVFWFSEFLLDTQTIPSLAFPESWTSELTFSWDESIIHLADWQHHRPCTRCPSLVASHRHIKSWSCMRQEAFIADTPPVPIYFIWLCTYIIFTHTRCDVKCSNCKYYFSVVKNFKTIEHIVTEEYHRLHCETLT